MIRFFITIITSLAISSASGQCDLVYTSVDPLCNGICDGQATVFPTGSSPFDITWSTGDSTEMIDSLCPGTYMVNMVDDLGCSAAVSITITEPAEPFIVEAYLVSNSSVSGPCEGQIGWTVSGGQPDYTINWYDCGTMDQYTNMPYFCAGEYFSVFIDDNGCIDTSDCVTVANNVVGISDEFMSRELNIYPNPVKDCAYFSVAEVSPINFQIYSMTGQLILSGIIEDNQIDMSDIGEGQYILRVSTEQSSYSTRIIKE